MATEKIRVGVIGASMRNGWARDAHIPALRAFPEFEITAVSTSRQETADETAKYFGIPHAFADPGNVGVNITSWTKALSFEA